MKFEVSIIQKISHASYDTWQRGVPGELTLIVSTGIFEDAEQNGIEFQIPDNGRDYVIIVGDELELSGG